MALIVMYTSVPYRTFIVSSENVYVSDRYGLIENVVSLSDQNDLLAAGCVTIIPVPTYVVPTGITKQAAQNILAGQPVISNLTGQLILAQANFINNCKAPVIAGTSGNIGQSVQLAASYLTLSDWSGVIGSPSLIANVMYFLSASVAGTMTSTPPSAAGEIVLRMGLAIDGQTLAILTNNPIQL